MKVNMIGRWKKIRRLDKKFEEDREDYIRR